MELTDFLLARLDEDHAAAKAAYDEAGDYRMVGSELAELHFVRWRPDRVMAEVEVKRRIVELVESPDAEFPDFSGGFQTAWEETLRLLALPFSDHDDFDESWKP